MADPKELLQKISSSPQLQPYALTLMTTEVEFRKEIPTLATNGVSLFINPEFWNQQTTSDQIALLVHEACHILDEHTFRFGKPTELTNIAADLAVNSYIERKTSLNVPEYLLLPQKYNFPDLLSAEDYLELLKRKEQEEEEKQRQEQEKEQEQNEQEESDDSDSSDSDDSNDSDEDNESEDSDDSENNDSETEDSGTEDDSESDSESDGDDAQDGEDGESDSGESERSSEDEMDGDGSENSGTEKQADDGTEESGPDGTGDPGAGGNDSLTEANPESSWAKEQIGQFADLQEPENKERAKLQHDINIANVANSCGCSQVFGDVIVNFQDAHRFDGIIDYKIALRELFSTLEPSERTFKKVNPQFAWLEGCRIAGRRREPELRELFLAIDTSGSVITFIPTFLKQIEQIWLSFPSVKITVGLWTTELYYTDKLQKKRGIVDEVQKHVVTGGTVAIDTFEHAMHKNYDAIAVLTDGLFDIDCLKQFSKRLGPKTVFIISEIQTWAQYQSQSIRSLRNIGFNNISMMRIQ